MNTGTLARADGEFINQNAQLYDKLIDALHLINKCYSIQVPQQFFEKHFAIAIN